MPMASAQTRPVSVAGSPGGALPSRLAVLDDLGEQGDRALAGGLDLGVVFRVGQLGPQHEVDVGRVPGGEPDVGLDQGAEGGGRGGGVLPGLAQALFEQPGSAHGDRGEQRRAVREVVIRRARADPGLAGHPAQAHRADALGLDELEGRGDELLAQSTVVVGVAGGRGWHVPSVSG